MSVYLCWKEESTGSVDRLSLLNHFEALTYPHGYVEPKQNIFLTTKLASKIQLNIQLELKKYPCPTGRTRAASKKQRLTRFQSYVYKVAICCYACGVCVSMFDRYIRYGSGEIG